MKQFLLGAAILSAMAALVIYVQHQLVTVEHIEDPTMDIWN